MLIGNEGQISEYCTRCGVLRRDVRRTDEIACFMYTMPVREHLWPVVGETGKLINPNVSDEILPSRAWRMKYGGATPVWRIECGVWAEVVGEFEGKKRRRLKREAIKKDD